MASAKPHGAYICCHSSRVTACGESALLDFPSLALAITFRYLKSIMTAVRIDKWLWAARFFKTRALAARACDLGRICSNGQLAKPAREVHVGDMLQVTNDGGDFQVKVLLLSEVRGPAPVARTLYLETDQSLELRAKLAAERKAMGQFEIAPEGRPSKRDRREINRLRGRG
jgi:ribosome-associated heat shock protein Hsp15